MISQLAIKVSKILELKHLTKIKFSFSGEQSEILITL
jgi:hypothetical protein